MKPSTSFLLLMPMLLTAAQAAPVAAVEDRLTALGEILGGDDMLAKGSALDGLFDSVKDRRPGTGAVEARGRSKGARVIKTAAGDGDIGWPPENPFGKQRPPRQDPPRPEPPRQDPPRQEPPRRETPPSTPPREIPQLPPSNIPGTTRPAK